MNKLLLIMFESQHSISANKIFIYKLHEILATSMVEVDLTIKPVLWFHSYQC